MLSASIGAWKPQLSGVRQPAVQTRMWGAAPQLEKSFLLVSHSEFSYPPYLKYEIMSIFLPFFLLIEE